jgi:hypothetical protein
MRYEIYSRLSQEGDIEQLSPKSVYSIGELESAKQIERFSANRAASYGRLHTKTFGILSDGGTEIRLGVVGAIKQWGGFATIWAIFDKETERYPIALTKSCLALIDEVAFLFELRRVSFTVRSDYNSGHRFAEMLGFSFEGRMYGYLPDGANADLYARLFK